MDTHQYTTLTAMCKRVNFIFASISVFKEKVLWIYLALFSLDFLKDKRHTHKRNNGKSIFCFLPAKRSKETLMKS